MRILVVGAGIAGLAVGGLLGRHATVDVVEKHETFRITGAGIIIHANGLLIVRKLGLLDAILEAGEVIDVMEHATELAAIDLPLRALWNGLQLPTIGIGRIDLHRVLLSGCRDANIRMGTTVTNVEPAGDVVLVDFSDGRRAEPYDLVVAADGVHSSIRASLFPEAAASHNNLVYWRYTAKNALGLRGRWISVDREDVSFGIYPIGRQMLHSHIMFRSADSPCPRGSEDAYLASHASRWDRRLRDVLASRVTPIQVNPSWTVRPPVWHKGRVVFIGDAAHAISPTVSLGGSLALEDAFTLARHISAGLTIPAAIGAFVSDRDPTVRWALKMARAQVRAATMPNRRKATVSAGPALEHMRHIYAPLLTEARRIEALPESAAV
jgi:2-polyprenyl-6-methoxyphenol hydroxylase-like FAD-dependent oxidoreductase